MFFLLFMNCSVLFLLFTSLVSKGQEAVCTVPVADLLTQKVISQKNETVAALYKKIPFSETPATAHCTRATQILYNQRVTLIKEEDEQVFIQVPYWHLKTPTLKNPTIKNDCFWTLATNITPVKNIPPEMQSSIPSTTTPAKKMIVLTTSWYCPQTDLTYSAGTRFITKKTTANGYWITLFDPSTKTVISCSLSKEKALSLDTSLKNKRTIFLELLREWAHTTPYSIPYVLGGASTGTVLTTNSFTKTKVTEKNGSSFVYNRPSCQDYPHVGMDCSGMIRLACSIAGIPLHATNSKSIAYLLEPLCYDEAPDNGDIIYWTGHIAIISDVKKGLLIEARGYDHGYGIIHEIPYAKELRGIETTADLMNAYTHKTPLERIDNKGVTRQTITDLMIFKFPTL